MGRDNYNLSVLLSVTGAIFTSEDKLAKTAFRYALSTHNDIKTNPFALAAYIDEINVSDSFTLASTSKHICIIVYSTLGDVLLIIMSMKNILLTELK